MEKLTQKWCIAAFFNELDDGFEFHRSEVPLHVTLAGVFAIDDTDIELFRKLQFLLKDTKPFEIQAGDSVEWGKDKEIKVVLIENSSDMLRLLMQIYEFLIANGAVFNEPQYEGKGHILHSTIQKSGRLQKGQVVKINNISLVDMYPDEDGMRRRIVGTIKF
jgi:2'-5' RNA ligase